jgi:hypothetical protein
LASEPPGGGRREEPAEERQAIVKDRKKADERRGLDACGEHNLDDYRRLSHSKRRTAHPGAIDRSEDGLLGASLEQSQSAAYPSNRTRCNVHKGRVQRTVARHHLAPLGEGSAAKIEGNPTQKRRSGRSMFRSINSSGTVG